MQRAKKIREAKIAKQAIEAEGASHLHAVLLFPLLQLQDIALTLRNAARIAAAPLVGLLFEAGESVFWKTIGKKKKVR